MKLPNEFYVVQKKSYLGDTLYDLLSKENIKGLRFRFIGGIEANEIIGIYTTKSEALPIAQKELKSKVLYKRNKN